MSTLVRSRPATLGPIQVRRWISGRLAVATAILAIGAIVAAEHTTPLDTMHMNGAMVTCLAILPLLALTIAAAVVALRPSLGLPWTIRSPRPRSHHAVTATATWARAGPRLDRSVLLRI